MNIVLQQPYHVLCALLVCHCVLKPAYVHGLRIKIFWSCIVCRTKKDLGIQST